jgi:hypothetical protein
VAVAGLDLREFIQSPTDLFGTRDGGDRLDQVMKSLPTVDLASSRLYALHVVHV